MYPVDIVYTVEVKIILCFSYYHLLICNIKNSLTQHHKIYQYTF